jgi:drug/metabolite transporter (DMT)-like permease
LEGEELILGKLAGVGLILAGLAFVFVFPAGTKFQWEKFTNLAIIIGIFLILLGILLVAI